MKESPGRERSVLVTAPRDFAGDRDVLTSLFAAIGDAPWLRATPSSSLLYAAVDAEREPAPATPEIAGEAEPPASMRSPLTTPAADRPLQHQARHRRGRQHPHRRGGHPVRRDVGRVAGPAGVQPVARPPGRLEPSGADGPRRRAERSPRASASSSHRARSSSSRRTASCSSSSSTTSTRPSTTSGCGSPPTAAACGSTTSPDRCGSARAAAPPSRCGSPPSRPAWCRSAPTCPPPTAPASAGTPRSRCEVHPISVTVFWALGGVFALILVVGIYRSLRRPGRPKPDLDLAQENPLA